MTPQEIAALQAENQRLRAAEEEVAARAATLAAQAAQQEATANVAFCERLVTDAKLHPGQKDNAIAILNGLSAGTAVQEVEFSEGANKSKLPLADAFKALMNAQPKIVEFGEAGKPKGNVADLDDPNLLAAKAVEFQESEAKAGRVITIAEAVSHVTKG